MIWARRFDVVALDVPLVTRLVPVLECTLSRHTVAQAVTEPPSQGMTTDRTPPRLTRRRIALSAAGRFERCSSAEPARRWPCLATARRQPAAVGME
jgi:hypothetical protein